MSVLLGAIEAGGTKFVIAIGTDQGDIIEKKVIPTEHPDITVPKVLAFFEGKGIERLGLGGFGPIDINESSPTYGQLLKTPKIDWIDYPLGKTLEESLGVPVVIDTDVNVAAMSEAKWGKDRKSTRLNSSHVANSYAVFRLKKKTNKKDIHVPKIIDE